MLSMIVTAFIFIAAITEILIVPATLANVSVSGFALFWWIVFGAGAAAFIVIRRKMIAEEFKKSVSCVRGFVMEKRFGGVYGILAVLLILVQLFGSVYLTHYDDDDTAYVTIVSSNVATDRFMRTYGQTGEEISLHRMAEYVTSGWYNFLSVISKTFGLHPLILMRTIIPPLMIALTYGIYVLLARRLFKKESSRYLFLVFCSLINILNNVSSHTSSSVLLMRMHQGKAIFANIIIPVMFCLFFRVWDEYEDRRSYILLALTNTAACFFTTSGLVYGAMITLIYGLVLWIRSKKPAAFAKCALAVLPNAALAVVYIIMRL